MTTDEKSGQKISSLLYSARALASSAQVRDPRRDLHRRHARGGGRAFFFKRPVFVRYLARGSERAGSSAARGSQNRDASGFCFCWYRSRVTRVSAVQRGAGCKQSRAAIDGGETVSVVARSLGPG